MNNLDVISDSGTTVVCSALDPIKIKYEWIVKNYNVWNNLCQESVVPRLDYHCQSPLFPNLVESPFHECWRLSIQHHANTNFELCIQLQSKVVSPVKKLTIISKCDDKDLTKNSYVSIEPKLWLYVADLTEDIHTKNSFVITCYVEIFDDNIVQKMSEIKSIRDDVEGHTIESRKNFESLLINGEFSDMKIVIKEKEINVHKAILGTLNPVFRAMFSHDTSESRENLVRIDDVSYEILYELLRFIYSGNKTLLDAEDSVSALDLFVAADKYGVDGLKRHCEKYLRSNINEENAVEILVVADRHSAINLKNRVCSFIRNNPHRIIESTSFKALSMDLVADILASIGSLAGDVSKAGSAADENSKSTS